MATSVHIPPPLLQKVDRRARSLRISRNRLIIRALERELEGRSEWSPGFFERLARPDADLGDAVDDLLAAVLAGRRSKAPRSL